MKSLFKLTSSPLTAMAILVAVLSVTASAQSAGTPVGVWEVDISFRDCSTGNVLRTRPGLMTFMPGGVMQEFGTGTAPNDRSDAQGVWKHATGRTFTSVSKAFRFAADGSFAGSMRLYREFSLSADGSSIEVTVNSRIYDAAGNLITNGCATEIGTRLEQ